MPEDSGERLRARLRALGLSRGAISAAWPRWWSTEADSSVSARAELRFGVARRLGLDPRSLLDDEASPRFLWHDEARFKRLSGEDDLERAGITSFGHVVASLLTRASPAPAVDVVGTPAAEFRRGILDSGRPFVSLADLLALSWSVGVPVVHLRVFPWPHKRMAAMTASVGGRCAVLLARDSIYPAPVAFYLGHELGHIALGQLAANASIVDFEDGERAISADDDEEQRADEYALELLTGQPRPTVLGTGVARPAAKELARVALGSAVHLGIEPGTLAQCYGFSTGNWRAASASLRYIYTDAKPVWAQVNGIARRQLHGLEERDGAEFVDAILGSTAPE